jgi:methionine-rich copper-binding protein CopC
MKIIIAAGLLLAAAPAFAHARLTESTPAANASVKSADQVRLHFSETLEPAFSGATLKDEAGKVLPVSAAVGAAAITLITPGLRPGTYTVEWHSVGHDSHRVTGHFSFKIVP